MHLWDHLPDSPQLETLQDTLWLQHTACWVGTMEIFINVLGAGQIAGGCSNVWTCVLFPRWSIFRMQNCDVYGMYVLYYC